MTMPLDFSSMIGSAQKGEVLIPVIYKMLNAPDFKGFDVDVEPFTTRPYDGYFHPSSHSLFTVRQLYLYLTRPDVLQLEGLDLKGVLAVTAGKFWHRFFQMLWLDEGVLLQDEVRVHDESTRRTGHADGLLRNGDALEIKSVNDFQILKIENEEVLKDKKPQYWGQTQDYLDILGIDAMRYFTIAPTWPFHMGEFVVRADQKYQIRRRNEYLRAVELAEKHPEGNAVDESFNLVSACCSPKSKTAKQCFARLACPIGRFGQ